MVHPPKEILHLLYYDEKIKEMVIREDATEEQKHIFKQFLKESEDGTLTDRIIKIEV
jgi:hypothetical protein